MPKNSFFSLSEIKQPVNQWICIAFLGIWCVWLVIYFASKKAEVFTNAYAANAQFMASY